MVVQCDFYIITTTVTSTGNVPTSITTEPGFSQLPRTRLGTPTAVITMSASRVICSGFFVNACTTLTVAWCLCSTTNAPLNLVIEAFDSAKTFCRPIKPMERQEAESPAKARMQVTQRCCFSLLPQLSSPLFPHQTLAVTRYSPLECKG